MTDTVKTENKSNLGLMSFIFAVVYIFAELTFNLGLVDFLNSPNTEIGTFHNLEMFGRFLSSIGLGGFIATLIALIFKSIASNKPLSIIIFIIASVGAYGAQTMVFNKILDSMTTEQKFSAYSFGVYRNLNLNNQVNLKILNGENKNYDMVINSMLGVFTTVPAIEKDIKGTVQKFFHAENNVDQVTLGKIYDEINVSLPNFDDYWGIYVIESRRYNNYGGIKPYKDAYRKKFIQAVGVEPNLSREEFEKHMINQMPSIKKSKEIVIVPANPGVNLQELRIGQIPEGLTKTQWINYVNKHINTALETVKFTEANLKRLPHSENIISSVVITPIAVILSLVALFLNIILLIARFTKIGAIIALGAILGVGTSWTSNPYNLNPTVNKFIGLETRLVDLMIPYMKIIHSMAIDDTNPNQYEIIRIEKPKMPDMSKLKEEMDAKFKSLKSIEGEDKNSQQKETLERIQKEIKVDNEKINNESYYGELRKANPYAK